MEAWRKILSMSATKRRQCAPAAKRPILFPGQGAESVLDRIADALERLAPPPPAAPDFLAAEAFVWHPEGRRLAPVARVNRVEMSLLKGIDRVRDLLVENTERFARGLPANNALLWGARGMGKSSLVKAAHAAVGAAHPAAGLRLIEIHREDIELLPELMALLRKARQRFHRVLRRSFVRRRRHLVQVAQDHAGRRHRRAAGQCHLLRHVEPAASAGARDGRERTLDRDQSR